MYSATTPNHDDEFSRTSTSSSHTIVAIKTADAATDSIPLVWRRPQTSPAISHATLEKILNYYKHHASVPDDELHELSSADAWHFSIHEQH
jgi:hypothetical protein